MASTFKKVLRPLLTFDPGRLFGDEGISDVSGDPRAGAPGEDPRPRRLGGLEQALAQALLEPWLELEVGLAAVDGDEELGLLEAPLAEQEGEDELGPGVVGQADVL